MSKASPGRLFEDFAVGQILTHPIPRTVHGGDLSLYMALTADRNPLASSTEFARSLGFVRETVPELLAFHLVFGKSVADISQLAIANLGYAEGRFLLPVYPGDTLIAESEVLGLRETSNGQAGVVYVRTRGVNQKGQDVMSFVRWVLVPKRTPATPTGHAQAPTLAPAVAVSDLAVPPTLNLQRFHDLRWVTGAQALWEDHASGERIEHPGAMTIEEADHISATRLYQNTAQVHFDAVAAAASKLGRRIVYGGHVISVAAALAQHGLGNALWLAAINGGAHVAPTFGGDTISAVTEVVECAELPKRRDLGALRLRLYALKNVPRAELGAVALTADAPGGRDPRVVLELDTWALMPRARKGS
ncbi:MAG: MaoC family dehydratase [Kofleriaceae bacterium]